VRCLQQSFLRRQLITDISNLRERDPQAGSQCSGGSLREVPGTRRVGELTQQIETVRHLHILSSQLIRLRRSLTPLLHVAYIIRDQDAQRSAAASAMTTGPRPGDKNHGSRDTQWLAGSTPAEGHHSIPVPPASITFTGPSRPGTPSIKSLANNNSMVPANSMNGNGMGGTNQGFFSPMTKVYIGDVLDHLEIIVSNLDQFVATCDHLTDYVFVSGPVFAQRTLRLTAECHVVPVQRVHGEVEHRHSRLPA